MSALGTLAERLPGTIGNASRPTQEFSLLQTIPAGWCILSIPRQTLEVTQIMLYLAPQLESLPQSVVDSAVADGFAHAILRHEDPESFPLDAAPKNYSDLLSEIAADELIGKCGYAPANE